MDTETETPAPLTNGSDAKMLTRIDEATTLVVQVQTWVVEFGELPKVVGETLPVIINALTTIRGLYNESVSVMDGELEILCSDLEKLHRLAWYLIGPLPEASFPDSERAADYWAHQKDLERMALRCHYDARLLSQKMYTALGHESTDTIGRSPIHAATVPGSFRLVDVSPILVDELRQHFFESELNDEGFVDEIWSWLFPVGAGDPTASILDLAEPFRSILFPQPFHVEDDTFLFDIVECFDVPTQPKFISQERIRRALLILACLGHYTKLSAQIGAWLLANLSIELFRLEFYEAAVVVATYVANEYRRMNSITHDSAFNIHLAINAINWSTYAFWIGDHDEALTNVTEAWLLLTDLMDVCPSPLIKYVLARACRAKTTSLTQDNSTSEALESAQQAASTFKSILDDVANLEQVFSSLRGKRDPPPHCEALPQPPKRYFLFEPLTWRQKFTHDYGMALHRLSYCHHDLEQFDEAIETAKEAVKYLTQTHEINPDYYRDIYAEANYHLIQPALVQKMDDNEVKPYGQAATDAFRTLWSRSKNYSLTFYNSLWEYAMILSGVTLKDYEHACRVWEEMAHVAKEGLLDPLYLGDSYRQLGWVMRRLKRSQEAIIYRKKCAEIYHRYLRPTSKHEADCLHELAVDLFMVYRTQEAAHYEDEAINYYRQLYNSEGTDALRECLALSLAYRLAFHLNLKDPESAIQAGCESLDYYDSMDDPGNPNCINNYIYALRVTINAAFQHDNEQKTLPISRACMQKIRDLYREQPEKALEGLMEMSSVHAIKLTKHNLMDEAVRWSEEVIAWYETLNFENAPAVVNGYLECLINFTEDLTSLGNLSRARECLEKTVAFGEKHCTKDNLMSTPLVAASLHNLAEIALEVGDWEGALKGGRKAMSYIEEYKDADVSLRPGALLFQSRCVSLMIQGTALARLEQYEEAREAVQESLRLCETAPMTLVSRNNMFAPLLIPRALAGLAEIMSDMGRYDKAFEAAQRALSEFRSAVTLHSLPSAFTDVIEGYCAANLAEQLAFRGEIEEGVRTLESIIGAYKKSTSIKPGNYPYYAPLLDLMGTLYCANGSHVEGWEMACEIQEIRDNLARKRPGSELTAAVDVQLEKELSRPSRKALKEKLRLTCNHQDTNMINPRVYGYARTDL